MMKIAYLGERGIYGGFILRQEEPPEEFDEEQYLQNAELILDSARGVYIPRDFWEAWPTQLNIVPDISEEKIFEYTEILSNPDNENYHEAWTEVLEMEWFDPDNNKFEVYQSEHGDLWLVQKDK